MKRIFFTLCSLLLWQANSMAQVTGVRAGTITAVQTAANNIMYMDDERAAIVNITSMAPKDFIINVGSPALAAQFALNDMVLIIQMRGGPVGQHQNAVVRSISGPSIRVTVVGPSLLSFAAGGSARLQLVRIPEFKDLIITGGQISCHPWEETKGIGGVLCFTVSGKLTVAGGIINAAAKGFGPDGVTWGLGGNGAAGATVFTPGGNPAPTDAYIRCVGTILSPGFDGGAANNPGAAGILNAPVSPVAYNPGPPVFKVKAVMGMAGYYPASFQGGKGAGGGGKGGNGANTCAGTGATGANGLAGQKGGNAGRGALGGGIMIIKAQTLDATSMVSNRVYFNASGQNGDYGRPGGNGGFGGAGGLGADGSCGSCDPGGPGGRGASGDPATGGDGSNPAAPGTLWIAAGKILGTISGTNAIVNAGAAGLGGPGGYSWTPYSGPQSHVDPCSDTPCSIPTNCTDVRIKEVCNPYKAFCLLATATSSAYHTPGSNGISNGGYDYKNSGGLVAIYDSISNILYGVEFDPANCLEIHYRANLYSSNDCIRIFRKMAYNITLAPSPTGQKIDLSKTRDSGTCTTAPSGPKITFNDAFDHAMFVFRGVEGYIEDVTEPGAPRCYIGSCISATDPVVPGSVRQGIKGRDPEVLPADGIVVIAGPSGPITPNANAVIQDMGGAPLWRIAADEEETGGRLSLYPQPADNEVKLVLTDRYSGNTRLSIYDLNGRLLKEWDAQLAPGQRELSIALDAFQPGMYLLKVSGNAMEPTTLKLLVE